mmetsp:Transcript_7766/g.10602  ORF Transcript_7766/g.10602 Transcript_7766/m.10602 type:complete len:263 (-) Transcript_7766:98-886(-)|eukprot:CAMPEP_0185737352 /NCGR_PEP_ID=MMETSP1171-20130828/30191_1 /TAXON_ID=374046 /ORGANISM="Helicotheca tamensis, Strain CCMP826" /LENGTH=262 /DNA_ID=CAMNT_0028408253 /DNA_START=131 /DNA_END=919 /DNA_ORIENTATION=+
MKVPCTILLVPSIIFSFLLLPPLNDAYRINEAIGLSIRTINPQTSAYEQKEALRSEVPLFGRFTSCKLSLPLKNERGGHYSGAGLSLSFADGSMSIPWYNLIRKKGNRRNEEKSVLRSLLVNFVYSSDGGSTGEIHSISSHPVYAPQKKEDDDDLQDEAQVEVVYIWLEEASVDIQGGALVMFIGTLIATLAIVVLVCYMEEEEEEEEELRKKEKDESLYGSGDDGNYYQPQQKEEDRYIYRGGSTTTTAAYRRGGGGGKSD